MKWRKNQTGRLVESNLGYVIDKPWCPIAREEVGYRAWSPGRWLLPKPGDEIGVYETLQQAQAACVEHWQNRQQAGEREWPDW